MNAESLDSILDINTLEQYCNAIGQGALLKSVTLLEQLLPEYLDNLKIADKNGDKEMLCSEAHKFKGAAGSVGLKRVREYAQLLQHGEEENWAAEHKEWLTAILEFTSQDVASLRAYLEAKD